MDYTLRISLVLSIIIFAKAGTICYGNCNAGFAESQVVQTDSVPIPSWFNLEVASLPSGLKERNLLPLYSDGEYLYCAATKSQIIETLDDPRLRLYKGKWEEAPNFKWQALTDANLRHLQSAGCRINGKNIERYYSLNTDGKFKLYLERQGSRNAVEIEDWDADLFFPVLTKNGKILIFSALSTHKGGRKNYDLYISYNHGKWTKPVPLSHLNTDNDEISTFFQEGNQKDSPNDMLFFTSGTVGTYSLYCTEIEATPPQQNIINSSFLGLPASTTQSHFVGQVQSDRANKFAFAAWKDDQFRLYIATDTLEKQYKNYHLITIAIDNYDDPYWDDFNKNLFEAQELGGVLEDNFGFQWDAARFELENANKKDIVSALREFARVAEYDHHGVIIFTGHGYKDSVTNMAYWIPSDGGPPGYPETWVSVDTIVSIFENHPTFLLFFIDACFGGLIDNSTRGPDKLFHQATLRCAYALCSTYDQEPKVDNYFFEAITEVLQNAADNDESIDQETLFKRVSLHSKIKTQSEQKIIMPVGRPIAKIDKNGKFVFKPKTD
ncbi:MAG: caspase family protein [Saprospiraceae bacterium]|nr:caspase family protein [Saprospiraceae bacterium]